MCLHIFDAIAFHIKCAFLLIQFGLSCAGRTHLYLVCGITNKNSLNMQCAAVYTHTCNQPECDHCSNRLLSIASRANGRISSFAAHHRLLHSHTHTQTRTRYRLLNAHAINWGVKVIKTKIILSSYNFQRLQFIFFICFHFFAVAYICHTIHKADKVLLHNEVSNACAIFIAMDGGADGKANKTIAKNLFGSDKVLRMDCEFIFLRWTPRAATLNMTHKHSIYSVSRRRHFIFNTQYRQSACSCDQVTDAFTMVHN